MRSFNYHILIFIFFTGITPYTQIKDCAIDSLETIPGRLNNITDNTQNINRTVSSIQKSTYNQKKENLQYDLPNDSIDYKNEALDKVSNFPSKFFTKVNGKISTLQRRLDKQSQNYINKLLKSEARLKKEISKLDSNATNPFFSASVGNGYNSILQQLKLDTSVANVKNFSGEYYPYIDTLQTALLYLSKNHQLASSSKIDADKISSTLKNLLVLQSKMQDADQIKQFIQQRKEQIKQYIKQYTNLAPAVMKTYQKYNEKVYYYTAQIKQYRETLNDPDKLTKLALNTLNKVPAFANFVKQNSILASIFNVSGTYSPSVAGQGSPGRDQVLAFFQKQVNPLGGSNVSSLVQKNIQSASGVVGQLKDKIKSYAGNNESNIDLPNFTPNAQKSKSFLKRLQIGTDFQTVHSTSYFPASTDFGISVAYKLNNKNVIGIGSSLKMGWGKDINHIKVTGEGASIRSFTDINIRKNFYASGGFEYNYQQPFNPLSISQLQNWTRSGLIGISKKTALNSKVMKEMKMQLLWDFLSYQQIPRTQPLKFRIGYSF